MRPGDEKHSATSRTMTDAAAARLAELSAYYRTRPVTGPTERSAPSITPAAPLNLGVVDHIRQCVYEVETHTRAVAPDAGPIPQRVQDAYEWSRENTAHADEIVQQRRVTMEYRHWLENSIRVGDRGVVRPHRCPACGTLGLMWRAMEQKAACVNRYCAKDNGGIARTWTLARLAHEHVTAQNYRNVRAT